jgi:pyridoxine 5-phosphate synthase
MMKSKQTNGLRLGINIDHVATVRNARGGTHPDPVRAALLAMEAGADGITAHLREDRRHIRDADMARLKNEVSLPLNFEMAATDEMMRISLGIMPHAVCLVPEKRTEVTTEGGLDIAAQKATLAPYIARLNDAGIRVSLFIDADESQVRMAAELRAPVIELHTGRYCEAHGAEQRQELKRLQAAAALADKLGIECHAGHGLSFDSVKPVAAIRTIKELNIGHFLMGEAMFIGLKPAILEMRRLMDEARVI